EEISRSGVVAARRVASRGSERNLLRPARQRAPQPRRGATAGAVLKRVCWRELMFLFAALRLSPQSQCAHRRYREGACAGPWLGIRARGLEVGAECWQATHSSPALSTSPEPLFPTRFRRRTSTGPSASRTQ